jgi:hypothetical protein
VLQEFTMVKQEGGARRRRWFQGSGLDLIVWLDAQEAPEGFQICYLDAWRREHALTWRPAAGFTHARIESGDSRPDKNLTPILTAAGPVPWAKVRADFAEKSGALDTALRDFVAARLVEGAA